MPNLTPVENWLGCPTLPNRTSLVASASYSEPKIFHFLVLVRNCETWAKVCAPYAQQTKRTGEIIAAVGHALGGRPGQRLMFRLGMPISADTLIRHVKRAAHLPALPQVRKKPDAVAPGKARIVPRLFSGGCACHFPCVVGCDRSKGRGGHPPARHDRSNSRAS
jgi:hypothetical protein